METIPLSFLAMKRLHQRASEWLPNIAPGYKYQQSITMVRKSTELPLQSTPFSQPALISSIDFS